MNKWRIGQGAIVLIGLAVCVAGMHFREWDLVQVGVVLALTLAIVIWTETSRRHGLMLGRIAKVQRETVRALQDLSRESSGVARGIKANKTALSEVRQNITEQVELANMLAGSVKTAAKGQTGGPGASALGDSSGSYALRLGVPRHLQDAATPATTPRSKASRTTQAPKQYISDPQKADWLSARRAGTSYIAHGSPYRSNDYPLASKVRVAMIADEFTFASFKPEFDVTRLHPKVWRKQIEQADPAIFICESAWQGGPPGKNPWQAKIYTSVRWPYENREILLEILDYCNKKGIPTLFWNKEDPTHFSDRVNDFVRTAALFDFVMTTAEECVDGYRQHAGVLNVDVLPFAVQPRVFNPVGITEKERAAVFAGSWYRIYPERGQAAELMMDRVLEAGYGLSIYDRMSELKSFRYRFPDKFLPYVNPAIPYEKTATVFRHNELGITLNTVTNSPTMFARRAYELAASGSIILSNTAEGMKNTFGDTAIYMDGAYNPLIDLSESEKEQIQRGAMKIALSNTYHHRAESMLKFAGVNFAETADRVGIVSVVRQPEQVHALRRWFYNEGKFQHLTIILSAELSNTAIYELIDLQSSSVSIVSMEDIEDGIRTRNFLRTPIVYNLPISDLGKVDAEDILYTAACLQFGEGYTRITNNSSNRYGFAEHDSSENCAFGADLFRDALTTNQPISVLEV